MKEIIALSFLIGSLTGMAVVVFKKIPELKKIEAGSVSIFSSTWERWSLLKTKLRDWRKRSLELFSWDIIIQKILSQIRIAALRVERRCGEWLSKARERTRREKEREAYWRKLSDLATENSSREDEKAR